jgi:hypothetical protein
VGSPIDSAFGTVTRQEGTALRKFIFLGITLAMALASATIADAKTLYFNGAPKHDTDATVQFTVKGTVKKGKFHATSVLHVHVYNQRFTCYAASGAPATSGRLEGSVDDYGYPRIKPIRVRKNGSFSGSFTDTISDPISGKRVVVTLLKFSGRITNHKATGTYQSKTDPEGGIDDGYCGDAKPVAWSASRSALPPLPPSSI